MERTNDIKKIFDFVESVYSPGKFLIFPKHEDFHLYTTKGSYHIICARLMNLSYAQYLRYCRDQLGAEIIGKNEKYPIALFQKNRLTKAFVDLLNTRAAEVLTLRNMTISVDEATAFIKENHPRYWEVYFEESEYND